jgi:cellulose synthase/poly-beta-1,6-N-acetylglucosamine synthase-like glycosyltransferase
VERFLRELRDVAKEADPNRLVTYANYPPTEFLELSFLDFVTFNVYLHDLEAFRRYLFRLQNLVGAKPLVLGEIGMDTLRHGEQAQARFLEEQLREALLMGVAGVFTFGWTDDWYTGGCTIKDWAFGITRADRSAKTSYDTLGGLFSRPLPALLPARPPVSVVVCTYNGGRTLEQCLRSLRRLDYPQYEVIVVDDGSTDATADIVTRLRLPGVYLVRQDNAGKPAALNTGIRHARGDLLVLVDGDTVFEPDAVGRLIQPLKDPRVGAVSGNTKVANRRGLLGRWQHLEYVIGFNLDRRMFDIARCMPTVPGAIGAFRRAAVQDVGGVSAQTLAEDTDFTMAVIRAGWQVVYEPAAIAWTEAPATLRQLWRQRYRWCYGTMQAMWKHRRALGQRGAAGRLGRRGLSYLLLFQVLLPLCAPMVDVYGLYGVLFLPLGKVLAVWAGFTGVQVATAGYALHLDRERYGPLWSLPLQQIVYRQLMYLVVFQSTVMALLGGRLRWHRMARTGAATAHARAAARP